MIFSSRPALRAVGSWAVPYVLAAKLTCGGQNGKFGQALIALAVGAEPQIGADRKHMLGHPGAVHPHPDRTS